MIPFCAKKQGVEMGGLTNCDMKKKQIRGLFFEKNGIKKKRNLI